jgi:hypothetical protein
VAGRIDLHRAAAPIGNEHAVDQRQSGYAMVLTVADHVLLLAPRRFPRPHAETTVCRIDTSASPCRESAAAGHDIDQVEHFDLRLAKFTDEVAGAGRGNDFDYPLHSC